MERHLDEELAVLKKHLVKMCALAETIIGCAAKMLVNRDVTVRSEICQEEMDVDRLQMTVDELCLRLVALYQPTASDLRFILGAAKTNTDLERLADQALNISKKAERLAHHDRLAQCAIVEEMATVASGMVKDSLHAFVNRDSSHAREVIKRDLYLNGLKSRMTIELLAYMKEDKASIEQAIDLLLVSRNLERIGDHAKNIAENTIFVVEGKDIRHPDNVNNSRGAG